MEYKNKIFLKSINFLKFQYLHYLISGIIILLIVGFFATKGLNLGIDFSGGTVLEIETKQTIAIEDLREQLIDSFHEIDIQNYENNDKIFLLKINLGEIKVDDSSNYIKTMLQENLLSDFSIRRFDTIGAKVSEEAFMNGFTALFLAIIAITIYIWIRFNWFFSLCAILGLLHDAFIAFGFYVLFSIEFNLTSIAAVLTIIGYSINNSVVVFDRIRENLRKYKVMNMRELINLSVNNTLSRTIITALTTILACLVLAIFTSGAISDFSNAVIIGITAGTYSTIFIVTNLLSNFQLREIKANKEVKA